MGSALSLNCTTHSDKHHDCRPGYVHVMGSAKWEQVDEKMFSTCIMYPIAETRPIFVILVQIIPNVAQ